MIILKRIKLVKRKKGFLPLGHWGWFSFVFELLNRYKDLEGKSIFIRRNIWLLIDMSGSLSFIIKVLTKSKSKTIMFQSFKIRIRLSSIFIWLWLELKGSISIEKKCFILNFLQHTRIPLCDKKFPFFLWIMDIY